MQRPCLAGERGGPERQRTACRLLIAASLLILLVDWRCSLQQTVDIDANGGPIQLKSVKQYLDRVPGLEEPDR